MPELAAPARSLELAHSATHRLPLERGERGELRVHVDVVASLAGLEALVFVRPHVRPPPGPSARERVIELQVRRRG